MEPDVLHQMLEIPRFIGDGDVFLEVTNSVRILPVILYLERQFNSNPSTCLVHEKYVFFTNFMQIRLR